MIILVVFETCLSWKKHHYEVYNLIEQMLWYKMAASFL